MKRYYATGAGAAVLLFVIILIVSGIRSCAIQNRYEKEAKTREETVVAVRFYQSDEDDAPIGCMFVEKEKISPFPTPLIKAAVFSRVGTTVPTKTP